jgi:hypothetical protein
VIHNGLKGDGCIECDVEQKGKPWTGAEGERYLNEKTRWARETRRNNSKSRFSSEESVLGP